MSPEVQAWIEEQKPALVQAAEEYVEKSQIYLPAPPRGKRPTGKKAKQARVSSSQLRNLLNIAQTERSLAVFRNFLRYQVGKRSSAWRDPVAADLLEQVVDSEISNRAASGVKAPDLTTRELEASLLLLLVGYIIREYTYQCRKHGTSSDG